MLELGGDADLTEEALAGHAGHDRGVQDLDGHLAPQLAIAGQEHSGHAAPPRLPLDDVAVAQGVLESGQQLAHRAPSPSSTPVTCGAPPVRRLWIRLSAGTLFLRRTRYCSRSGVPPSPGRARTNSQRLTDSSSTDSTTRRAASAGPWIWSSSRRNSGGGFSGFLGPSSSGESR